MRILFTILLSILILTSSIFANMSEKILETKERLIKINEAIESYATDRGKEKTKIRMSSLKRAELITEEDLICPSFGEFDIKDGEAISTVYGTVDQIQEYYTKKFETTRSEEEIYKNTTNIQYFFNDPALPYNPEILTPEAMRLDYNLVQFIDSAQESISAHFYQINNPHIVAAFVRAAKRLGPENFRLITDDHYYHDERYHEMLRELEELGCIIKHDAVGENKGNGQSHNKFAIVDDTKVWTGSFNITENGTFRNPNNALLVEDAELAAEFNKEFEEMYTDELFGKKKTANTRKVFEVENGQVKNQLYFAPTDDTRWAIIKAINEAKSSIKFSIFVMTDKQVIKALINKHNEGVKVKGVFDALQGKSKYSGYQTLKDIEGMEVIKDRYKGLMHHKFMVIDADQPESVVITGSYNWTKGAGVMNDENTLFVHNHAEISKAYSEQVDKFYQYALDNPKEPKGPKIVDYYKKMLTNNNLYVNAIEVKSALMKKMHYMVYYFNELMHYQKLLEEDPNNKIAQKTIEYFTPKYQKYHDSIFKAVTKELKKSKSKKLDEFVMFAENLTQPEHILAFEGLFYQIVEFHTGQIALNDDVQIDSIVSNENPLDDSAKEEHSFISKVKEMLVKIADMKEDLDTSVFKSEQK